MCGDPAAADRARGLRGQRATSKSITYTDDRGVANQPYPNNYRAEMLAFMKTYLNNPVGVHEAAMAEPVQRTVGGRLRYVSCLRFTPRESDGSYREPRERAVALCRWPARPRRRERQRALRRRGLCAISRTGKDDALGDDAVARSRIRLARSAELRSLFGEPRTLTLADSTYVQPRTGCLTGKKTFRCHGTKWRCCRAVTVANHHVLRHRREATKLRPRCLIDSRNGQ